MIMGASASQTGPSQAEPKVSALRASVPCAELRACPFCGNDNLYEKARSQEVQGETFYQGYVECWDCGCCGPSTAWYQSEKGARRWLHVMHNDEGWNARTDIVWQVMDDWCAKKSQALCDRSDEYILSGKNIDAAEYRRLLGQSQAFARMRSFIHGARDSDRNPKG